MLMYSTTEPIAGGLLIRLSGTAGYFYRVRVFVGAQETKTPYVQYVDEKATIKVHLGDEAIQPDFLYIDESIDGIARPTITGIVPIPASLDILRASIDQKTVDILVGLGLDKEILDRIRKGFRDQLAADIKARQDAIQAEADKRKQDLENNVATAISEKGETS